MKLRIVSIFTTIVLLICLSYLGYRFYQWHQDQQKRKQLFVYLQNKSPVTRRLPFDAVAYINVYDLKRVHEALQNTKFYDVLAHWFDTGMSDKQHANPIVGGMLEKTILDVFGQELGIALVASANGRMDFVAAARIQPGSEFILKIALASAKNARRIDFNGETIYGFPTKDSRYPEIFVYLGDEIACAGSDLERLKMSAKSEASGPAFLKQLAVEAIPQDTFLFAETSNPRFSLLGYGNGQIYHIRASSNSQIVSHLPDLKDASDSVLRFQTNGTEILKQPATTYSLQAIEGDPVTHVLLTFSDAFHAKQYSDSLLNEINANNSTDSFNRRGFDCHHYNKNGNDRFLCSQNTSILLADGRLDLQNVAFKLKPNASQKLPFTLRLDFRKDSIRDYYQRVVAKDWSRFDRAKEFYFLSCVQEINGTLDGSSNEITATLE